MSKLGPHPRPVLKIFGTNIAFVYPRSDRRPADQFALNLWQTGFSSALSGLIAAGMFVAAWSHPGQDEFIQQCLIITGVVLAFIALANGLVAIWRYRQRDRLIHEAMDIIPMELTVEDRRLIRRYASGREQVWPREQLADLDVERRTTSDGEDTIIRSELVAILRTGERVHLFGNAVPGSLPEQDLHWMRGELRQALQVPYETPPSPLTGASVEMTADGVVIHLPHDDPEKVWRADLWGLVSLAGGLFAFLGGSAFIVALADLQRLGFDGIRWDAVGFILLSACITGALLGLMGLINFVRKTSEIHVIADRTLVDLGVRTQTLFRKYASGREDTWRHFDIADVRIDCDKQVFQVNLHPKNGKPVHLFGKVSVDDANQLHREGLIWLVHQLQLGLGRNPQEPKHGVMPPNESIVDLNARRPINETYRV